MPETEEIVVTFGGLQNLASGRWKFPNKGIVGSPERYRMINGGIQKFHETVTQNGKENEIWVDDPSWR